MHAGSWNASCPLCHRSQLSSVLFRPFSGRTLRQQHRGCSSAGLRSTSRHSRTTQWRAKTAPDMLPHPPQPAHDRAFRWSTFVSRHGNCWTAIEEAAQGALAGFGPENGPEPTLALLFCSSSFSVEFDRMVPTLRQRFPSLQHIVGCTGFGVIAGSKDGPHEVEGEPGLSLTLGHLPQVEVSTVQISAGALPDADASPEEWQALMRAPIDTPFQNNFILLADPTFTAIRDLLSGLDYAYPEAAKIGGFCSSATQTAKRAMFCWSKGQNDEQGLVPEGCIALVLSGCMTIESLVAQGCRPLDPDSTWIISASQGNIIHQLMPAQGRRRVPRSPLEALRQDLAAMPDAAQEEATPNLIVATAADGVHAAGQEQPDEYIIKSIVGLDPQSGAVSIADQTRLGQRLRFMVRDRQGAQEDLQQQGLAYKRRELTASMSGQARQPPLGALIFSCNGRGRNLYGEPHYDSRHLAEFIPVPSSGFMCNGEIAQVGRQTGLHAFTCAVGVLRPLDPPD